MARALRRRTAAIAQEALDDTILQAVEGHHREPSAGLAPSLSYAVPRTVAAGVVTRALVRPPAGSGSTGTGSGR